jgi:hypothetical protein
MMYDDHVFFVVVAVTVVMLLDLERTLRERLRSYVSESPLRSYSRVPLTHLQVLGLVIAFPKNQKGPSNDGWAGGRGLRKVNQRL